MDLPDLEAIWEAVTPLHFDWIQVEISAVCQADCTYCPRHSFRDSWDGGLMTMKTFERLAPNFRRADLVFLQGWGEPLLHPHLWDMVRMVKLAGARAGFTTSGMSLVTQLHHLLEERVDIIGISLAGATAATHERLRSGCDFASIDEALRKIRELKNSEKVNKPGIHLAVILLQSNWREMEKLPALADAWGVDQVVMSQLDFIGGAELENESLLPVPEMWPEVETAMNGIRKEIEGRGIGFHYYKPNAEGPCAICTENVLNACFVAHGGDVSPCVMTGIPVKPGESMQHWFQCKPHPLAKCVFGNIHEKPLGEIWKSEKARNFRRSFKNRQKMYTPGLEGLPSPCRRCYKLLER